MSGRGRRVHGVDEPCARLAAFFRVQQQVENHVLVPKLMERQAGVKAVTVIIELLIGTTLLAIVGALLAVPTAAIAKAVFQEAVLPETAG